MAARSTIVASGLALVLFALPFFLYRPSFDNPLVWDDEIQVPAMREAPLARAFQRARGGYLRPMVLLSYRTQARLGIDTPGALHAVNIGVHAANGVFLFLLALALGVPALVAAAGAAVFSAHPLGSAAVAYVSGRTDLLAGLFTLLALHLARRRADSGCAVAGARALARASGVAVLIACAVLSKESGLLAGPLVVFLWWLEHRSGTFDTCDGFSPPRVASVVPAAAILTSIALAPFVAPPALAGSARLALDTRLHAAGTAVTAYARLAVFPRDLHLDRLTQVAGGFDAWIGAAAAFAVVVAVAAFAWKPTRIRFAFATLAVLSLPASNLLPVYPAIADHWVFTGEQLAYGPLAVLAVMGASLLAWLCDTLAGSPRVRDVVVIAAAAVAVTLSIAPVSARQAELADPVAVYRNTLAHSPSPRACFNLGVALLASGKAAEAASTYEHCTSISPHDAPTYVQLGVAYQRSGERNKAALTYAKALELDPRDPHAWSNYASLEASAGFFEQARAKWQRALELQPGFPPAVEGLRKLNAISPQPPAARPPS